MQPVAGGTPPKGAQGTMPLKQKPAVKQQGGGTFRLTSDAKKAPKESLPASVRFVSDAVRSDKVVFVAGATGRTGARIVRELLSAGFVVRAGARNVEEAEKVLDLAVTYGAIPADQAERIVVVPFDIEDESTFVEALGDANKVVCAVGASETAVFDTTGPQRIDGDGTTSLIEAATALGLDQFILISSLGTGKLGWPASVLNLFWGVLTQKRKSEVVLERSGLRYVIIRPGGMEKPTDAYKETHQVVLAPRDTRFGGQVSRLQVAELVAAAASDAGLAENKVLEVVAETSAPQLSYQALLTGIESDISAEAQLKAREATAEAETQLAAAQEALAAARSAAAEAEEQLAEVAAEVKEARAREAEFQREVAPVLAAGAAAEAALVDAREAAALAVREEAAARAVLDAAKRAAATGELLSEEDQLEVAQEFLNPPPPPAPKAKAAPPPKKGAASTQAVEGSADGSVDPEGEESEEGKAPVAKTSAKDYNPLMFFQPKQAAAPVAAAAMGGAEAAADVEGEEEVEEVEEEEQAPPQRKQSGFDSFFNFMVPKIATPKAEVEESVDEEEEQTEVEETPAVPVPVTNQAAALSASARASATEVVRVTPPAPVKAVAAGVEKAVATPVKAVVAEVKQAVAAPVKAVVEEVKQAVAAPIKAAAVEVVKAVAVPAMAAAPDVPEPAAAAVAAAAPPPPPQQTGWFASMFAAPLQLEDDTKLRIPQAEDPAPRKRPPPGRPAPVAQEVTQSEGETNSERRKRVMDEAKARMAGEQTAVMSGKREE
ncbi:MAG: hypothetical protein WDW36_000394 [Sanguina aurantia]